MFCNTSEVRSQRITWMKEDNVITHHNFSFYPNKYTGQEEKYGSTLTILNTTDLDFNVTYTCLSDVYSYDAVLWGNSSTIIYLPQYTDMRWTIIGKNVSVRLYIDNCFPVPKCRIMFQEDKLITHQQDNFRLKDWFYNGVIVITSHSVRELCGGNLTIVCMYGDSYYDSLRATVLQDCNVTDYADDGFGFQYGWTVMGILIPFISLISIGCLFSVYRIEKKMKTMRAIGSPRESQPLDVEQHEICSKTKNDLLQAYKEGV
ncbi:unnamed protein product [Mytilus coruscus]|uniref:Ig-like domain-containing protein n=1 Tax=Mytilus coruscus TaxID=42192 RepID=A0A6J8DJ83_MYTCO|nr:unnamed protein product [Mytilus coruscus]